VDGQPTPPVFVRTAPRALDDGGAQWRVRGATGEYGPVDLPTVRMWVQERRVVRTDFVYNPVTGAWSPAGSEPQLAYLFPPERMARVPYDGVKGWLLFFCVWLAFLMPLGTAYTLMTVHERERAVLEADPATKVFFLGYVALCVGLVAFSYYAGISLWKIRPHAVIKTKVYLVAYLVYNVGLYGLALLGGLSMKKDAQEFTQATQGLAISFFWFAVWFAYLVKSKRVRATYR
jgi:hypothetical protein